MKIILAGTVRLKVQRDRVELAWSAEGLWAWLCRRNVHRIRWDFPRDRWACSCGRDWFPSEEEREWLRRSRLRAPYREGGVIHGPRPQLVER